jgi:16S rRNA C967 or C1407 C5-methylase (RsmB/RsmF family)/NOL1/NOP2/fmu family ribosome biogenesis protein
MRLQLGEEYEAFESAILQTVTPISIRLNPFKRMSDTPYEANKPVPWCKDAFYLPERPIFTLDPAFHAGAYYVQEASSMFLHEALMQTVDFTKKLKVLDLCAAPGGKTTLLASMLNNDSLLVANEVIKTRTGVLRENLEKWGCPNIAITNAEVQDMVDLEDFFDIVVVDAPCSGEGMFRKDPKAMEEWSPENVEICVGRQKRILAEAVKMLAPNGILVYSTCTYNRQENEENCLFLEKEHNLENLKINILKNYGVKVTENGYRFYPHKIEGEGFFFSIFRNKRTFSNVKYVAHKAFKSITPIPKKQSQDLKIWIHDWQDFSFYQTNNGVVLALLHKFESEYLLLDKYLKIKWFGTFIGTFKGNDFIPEQGLALSNFLHPDVQKIALTKDEALCFLKKENLVLPNTNLRGWTLATYKNLPIGWLKILPNRFNNYYPQERRIRMTL